jgi:hypothetical protein
MESKNTIVVYSTDNKTYVIEKAGYKHTKAHKFVFEVDIPAELCKKDEDRIVLPKKRKIKEYIDTADKLQQWLQKELQKAVDSVK